MKHNVINTNINIDQMVKTLPPKHKRSNHVIVNATDLYKSFKVGERRLPVLREITLRLYAGEFVIIYGPSGCGKSTLLHAILGLEEPTRGAVLLRELDLYAMMPDERTNWRRQKVGMVFQRPEWIKSLLVWENVAYPLYLEGVTVPEAKARALAQLHEVGMAKFATRKPSELSGGQQQRVSLARALVTDPWMIVADEPTGNLDSKTGLEVLEMLARLNREKRRLIIMVTHEMGFLPIATRLVAMIDGQIVDDQVTLEENNET